MTESTPENPMGGNYICTTARPSPMTTVINPCPFCDNRPEPHRVGDDDGGYWSVEHQHSGERREMFIGCHGDSEEEAIKGWNSLTGGEKASDYSWYRGEADANVLREIARLKGKGAL